MALELEGLTKEAEKIEGSGVKVSWGGDASKQRQQLQQQHQKEAPSESLCKQNRSLLGCLGLPNLPKTLRLWLTLENLFLLALLRILWVWAWDEEERGWIELLKSIPVLRTAVQFLQDTLGWMEAMWNLRFAYSYIPGACEFVSAHGPSEKTWAKVIGSALNWLTSLR